MRNNKETLQRMAEQDIITQETRQVAITVLEGLETEIPNIMVEGDLTEGDATVVLKFDNFALFVQGDIPQLLAEYGEGS